MKKLIVITFLLCLCVSAFAQNPYFPKVLTLREQARVIDTFLEDRVETVLPNIMRRSGIDMWIIVSREYNEDPVLKTFLPSTWQSARRNTMLVIYDPGAGKKLETYAMARYAVGKMFKKAWDADKQPDQWKALAELIASKNPKKIGVNKSKDFALADGISAAHYDQLMDALPANLKSARHGRGKSGDRLARNAHGQRDGGLPEHRADGETDHRRRLFRKGHPARRDDDRRRRLVVSRPDQRTRTRHVVSPVGLGSAQRPRIVRAFKSVFRPSRRSGHPARRSPSRRFRHHLFASEHRHAAARLCLKTRRNAKPPKFLRDALKKGNRVQDILTGNFKTGRTGNEILKMSLDHCKTENIKCTIYTHPLGFHGHAAGTTIGLWDQQGGVPVQGDYPLYAMTAHSIELNAATFIKEWDKEIRIMLEEDAFFDGEKTYYIDGRQTELMTIPRELKPNVD